MPQQVSLAQLNRETIDSSQQNQTTNNNNSQNEFNPSNCNSSTSNNIIDKQGNSEKPNGNNASNKSAKPNGLKNRILQRPPPLILDKVSNFYDNQRPSTNNQASPIDVSLSNNQVPDKTASGNNTQLKSQTNSVTTNQVNQTNNNNNNINSANQKFWASLNNQNASRTNRSTIIVANNSSNPNVVTTLDNKDSSLDASSNNILDADLIITHHNSIGNETNNNGNGSSSGATLTLNNISKISKSATNINARAIIEKSHSQQQLEQPTATASSYNEINAIDRVEKLSLDNNAPVNNISNNETNDSSVTPNPHDMSNNSELDNSSTHGGGASENDGGNLIGVDHSTPPPTLDTQPFSQLHNRSLDDPPTSASSSRPRSNNPFLSMDEDFNQDTVESQHSNFHKRPASFIAATDSNLIMMQNNLFDQTNSFASSQQSEQLKNIHLTDTTETQQQKNSPHLMHIKHQNPYFTDRETILVDHSRVAPPLPSHDQRDSSIYRQSALLAQQQQNQPSIYGIYDGSYINYEPTISVDSESAVCRPPPSATMQLPYWTDAIYELNNAILETSSVAGGAEHGQFIYIVESGDIILELDHVKVSGFTLVEFNELVESKSVHLLSAVQTKHSHGLSTDLKHYLNCSYSKNSTDKELQDLIRENIYRRTIPCTTRPPKEGEVDKVDYHFLTKEQFVEMNNRGMLLECGMYCGHYYGTLRPLSDLNSLSIYGSITQREVSEDMRQPLNANHPAIGLAFRKDVAPPLVNINSGENPLYENHESLKMHQNNSNNISSIKPDQHKPLPPVGTNVMTDMKQSSIVAVDSEALPNGWERVIDQTHGTYYIDHNTQRTQYERPYEIELTKGAMGFGFTLVEAENGILLVRSVIPGGPAHMNGTIRPGDILISAVGVSVAGLQHTDIARLFSTFAVGDRVRLTFARSTYVVDANLVPDEYLFSNGTNGDLTVAVNTNYYNYFNQNMLPQSPHILVNQEFEYVTVYLKRGDQGFGFTISDSVAGQKVRKIQNNEVCANLKQGDILISLNGQDITKLTHKEVVERLKNFLPGQDVTLNVKRKIRFRSRTPMAMPTENDEYSLDSTPLRNCKTPSLDGLMLRRSAANQNIDLGASMSNNQIPKVSSHAGSIYQMSNPPQLPIRSSELNATNAYCTLHPIERNESQPLYNIDPVIDNEFYYNQQPHNMSLPPTTQMNNMVPQMVDFRPPSITTSDAVDAVHLSGASLPPMKFANFNSRSQLNQYNNFMNNDKLMMMQMQQQQQQQQQQPMIPPPLSMQNPHYHHPTPLYSNSDMLKSEIPSASLQQFRSLPAQVPVDFSYNPSNNYYANNEEIAQQRIQYECYGEDIFPKQATFTQYQDETGLRDDYDDYEYHQVDLDRGSTDSNWGIRLIGGSEVERAISIGSIVFGGAASKNGKLKSGDEIISINGNNVVGATHQHVVELISACSNRASLVVRRKKYAEACEVILTRSMDEGFGFVIISSGNCALIGRIIEGSPADRCQQLHVRDRIIAVNGRYITPNMQHPEIVNMIKECGSTLRLRIIPADCYTVELIKNTQSDNFGFSMRGGSEYDGTPLYILRVAPNGLARDLLNVGDQIIEINSIPTVGMTHQQAASIIKYSDPIVKLKLRRNYVTPPVVLVDSPRALQRFNQVTAEMKTVSQNATPSSYLQDGSLSSDLGSSSLQQSSMQQTEKQNQEGENNMVYGQSVPLYAS